MTEIPVGSTTSTPPEFTFRAKHHGDGGDAFGLGLIVMLLKVVTLGLYHFWGRTRIRRYLWSQTEWEGERAIYTGTGLELLLGYARAFFLVIVPIYIGFFALGYLGRAYAWVSAIGGLISAPLFLYLTGVALYASWRYRMSRTVWRGVRFGLDSSPWRYGWTFLGRTLLAVITGGLYVPHMQCRTTERVIATAKFGTERFAYSGQGKDLMRPYLRTAGWSGALVLIALLGVVALVPSVAGFGSQTAPGLFQRYPWLAALPPIGFLIVGGGIAGLWVTYQGTRLKYHVAHTTLGAMRFKLEFTWQAYLRLMLVNLLILAVSFGIAMPVTAVRTARFLAEHLSCSGALDYATIAQNQQPLGRAGEGLLQVFDMGEI